MRRIFVVALFGVAAACAGTPPAPVSLAVEGRANAHVTLAADGPRVAAAWAATGEKGTDIYTAVSTDEGRTFGRPSRVNDIDGDASVNASSRRAC